MNPKEWPRWARAVVGLPFDFDAETHALRDNNLSPRILSQGEYAVSVTMPRIRALLDKYDLSATFFGLKKRHEIGIHGWIHERNSPLSEEKERDVLQLSFNSLNGITDKAPVGIRTLS